MLVGAVAPLAALKAAKLLKSPTLRVCAGALHGITGTYEQKFNADLRASLMS